MIRTVVPAQAAAYCLIVVSFTAAAGAQPTVRLAKMLEERDIPPEDQRTMVDLLARTLSDSSARFGYEDLTESRRLKLEETIEWGVRYYPEEAIRTTLQQQSHLQSFSRKIEAIFNAPIVQMRERDVVLGQLGELAKWVESAVELKYPAIRGTGMAERVAQDFLKEWTQSADSDMDLSFKTPLTTREFKDLTETLEFKLKEVDVLDLPHPPDSMDSPARVGRDLQRATNLYHIKTESRIHSSFLRLTAEIRDRYINKAREIGMSKDLEEWEAGLDRGSQEMSLFMDAYKERVETRKEIMARQMEESLETGRRRIMQREMDAQFSMEDIVEALEVNALTLGTGDDSTNDLPVAEIMDSTNSSVAATSKTKAFSRGSASALELTAPAVEAPLLESGLSAVWHYVGSGAILALLAGYYLWRRKRYDR